MKPDRGLPDALDQVEYVIALLIAHGIAKDTAEQPDVVAQPGVFLERQRVLDTVGSGVCGRRRRLGRLDLGRLNLGRHGRPLQRFRGGSKSASFLLQSKIKLEAISRCGSGLSGIDEPRCALVDIGTHRFKLIGAAQ